MEHLDVLIVGAGLSGIGAAHYVQTKCPWASYAIFESRDAIGGTWDLFRYPGVRSDSDMFTLGYAFRPWDGEKSIADGASILQYIKDTAAESGIDRRIRFGHRIIAAEWSTDEALWNVTAQHVDSGDTFSLTCGWLFSCTGYYRYDKGYLPDFAGMDDFAGTIVHPQQWPEDLDCTGKRVVVIGSGATAVTLVPSLAASAAHVTMLQRSPTYIVSIPAKNLTADLLRKVLPMRYSAPATRWLLALTTQGSYFASKRWPGLVKRVLRKGIEHELPAGYDIDTHFTPRYNPWDQRLCAVPDGDLFKAISDGSASVVTDRISTFTRRGLRLESGAELEADIIVTATGLDLLFVGGMALSVDGVAVDIGSKVMYKGMMVEGVPNLAVAIGYTNASWTLKCELTCDHVSRLLNRLHESGLRQATPVNRGTPVTTDPVFGLASGYVERSAGRSPKQGAAFPWKVYHSYIRDYRALKLGSIEDDALVLSNPGRVGPRARARAGSKTRGEALAALDPAS